MSLAILLAELRNRTDLAELDIGGHVIDMAAAKELAAIIKKNSEDEVTAQMLMDGIDSGLTSWGFPRPRHPHNKTFTLRCEKCILASEAQGRANASAKPVEDTAEVAAADEKHVPNGERIATANFNPQALYDSLQYGEQGKKFARLIAHMNSRTLQIDLRVENLNRRFARHIKDVESFYLSSRAKAVGARAGSALCSVAMTYSSLGSYSFTEMLMPWLMDKVCNAALFLGLSYDTSTAFSGRLEQLTRVLHESSAEELQVVVESAVSSICEETSTGFYPVPFYADGPVNSGVKRGGYGLSLSRTNKCYFYAESVLGMETLVFKFKIVQPPAYPSVKVSKPFLSNEEIAEFSHEIGLTISQRVHDAVTVEQSGTNCNTFSRELSSLVARYANPLSRFAEKSKVSNEQSTDLDCDNTAAADNRSAARALIQYRHTAPASAAESVFSRSADDKHAANRVPAFGYPASRAAVRMLNLLPPADGAESLAAAFRPKRN